MNDESITEKNILKRLQNLQRKKTGAPSLPEDERARAEREIDDAVAKSVIKGNKDRRRSLRLKIGGGAAGVLLLVFAAYALFVPYQGGRAYGACLVFLQLHARYPQTIQVSTVEQFDTSVRIWYVDLDAFGQYRLEPIQCYFKKDEKSGGNIVDKITIDRREIDPVKVAAFNRSLPVVLENMPDLALPAPLPDSLESLQLDSARFFAPLLEGMNLGVREY